MSVADNSAKDIFLRALDWSSAAEQDAFAASACQGDGPLWARVADLLAAHRVAGKFLGGARPLQPPPPAAISAGRQIGPYTLVKELGAGGMGVVWLAEQTEPVQRRVALKVIRPGLDTAQVIARFAAEQQSLALMDHPNIARVLDAGTVGGTSSSEVAAQPGIGTQADLPAEAGDLNFKTIPYFVMELVEGTPLTHYCDERRLPIAERLKLFITVCQAVQHAHQKGIIHRDLKPSNVLVTEYDGQAAPKVIDFGVAKEIGEQVAGRTQFTITGQLVGTPCYMSPEQTEADQSRVDTRSDIYALGVLLYELLAGTTPLAASRPSQAGREDLFRAVRQSEPPAPSDCLAASDTAADIAAHRNTEPHRLKRLVRGELDWIALKCLEKDRARRYQSAGSVADDIRRHLEGLPVEAHRPSRLYRAQKFLSRYRFGVLAAAAFVVLLAGGLVGTSLGLRRAQIAYDYQRRLLYCADMNLAMEAWRANDRIGLVALLKRHVPQGREPDLRGFEWYHLWELSQRGQTQVMTLPYKPNSLVVSEDGSKFAVGLLDGTVQVYEFKSWRHLGSYGQKVPGTFSRTWAAFTHDGSRLVYHVRNAAIVADLKSGKRFPLPAEGSVRCLAISCDDRYLALGTLGGKVELWDLQERTRVRNLDVSPLAVVQTVGFSHKGHILAAGGDGRPLRIWDDVTKDQEPRRLDPVVAWDAGVRFAPGDQALASSIGTHVNLWRVRNGTRIHHLSHPTEEMASFAYSPDGRRIAVGTRAGRIHLWNTQTGARLSVQPAHSGIVSCVAFTPDGKFLLSAGGDRQVCLWMASLPVEKDTLEIQSGTRIAYTTPDGYLVAWNERADRPPRQLRIWNIHSREEVPIDFPGQGKVEQMAVSSGGRVAVALPLGRVVVLEELGNRSRELPPPARLVEQPPETAAVSPEPTDAALLKTDQRDWLTSLCFTPDEKYLIGGHRHGWLTSWEIASGKEVAGPPRQPGLIHAIRFSASGRNMAVAHANRVALFRCPSGAVPGSWTAFKAWQHAPGDTSALLNLQFHPRDEGLLAMGSQNGDVYLWRWQTDQPPRVFSGHTEAVPGIAFTPDGASVVSGGADQTVVFWDLASGQPRLRLKQGGPLSGHSLVFSADGQTLLSDD